MLEKNFYLTYKNKVEVFFVTDFFWKLTVKLQTMLKSKTAMQILPQNFTVDIANQITHGYIELKNTKGRITQTNTITMRVASTA